MALRRFVRATLDKWNPNEFTKFVSLALRSETAREGGWGQREWARIEEELSEVEQNEGRAEEILGIRRSRWMIAHYWDDFFSREFEGERDDMLNAIHKLTSWRNQAAHGYLDPAMLAEALDDILYVVKQINDDEAAEQVAKLRNEIGDASD